MLFGNVGIESDWKKLFYSISGIINNLMDNITSQMHLFADDSSLFTCVKGDKWNSRNTSNWLANCHWFVTPMENGI